MFLGNALGGLHSCDYTPTHIDNINSITLQNSIVDNLFATKNTEVDITKSLDKTWDFNTILNAGFNNNLLAGNINFRSSQCSSLRIKHREKGTNTWVNLFEIPISKAEDLITERFDRFCKGNKTEYEIAVVPVINGIESNYNMNSIVSDFDGIVLSEMNETFLTPLDVKATRQRNRPSSVLNTLDGKFPIVVINSQNNYDSGTASGVFIQLDENTCAFDVEHGWKYRDSFLDFLSDGKPKFLKIDTGHCWIVSIVDNISEDNSQHRLKVSTNFSWVSIGDIANSQDLYENGLVSVDSSGW